MQYKIRIYCGDEIIDVNLNDGVPFSIGSGKQDDYQLFYDDVAEKQISFRKTGNDCYINENASSERIINDGEIVIVSEKNKIAVLVYTPNNKYNQIIRVSDQKSVVIGRSDDSEMIFKDSCVSRKHARIYFEAGNYYLEDLKSANGTYLNKKRVVCAEIRENDIISVGKYDIIFSNSELKTVCLNTKMTKESFAETKERETVAYPYFKRSPRMKTEIDEETIEIQNPPSIGSKPQINWLSLLLMPTIMVVGGLVASWLNPMMLMFSVGGVLVAIVNYVSQNKKHKNEEKLRFDKYREYLEKIQIKIDEAHRKQLKALETADYSIAHCLNIVEKRESKLWDRRPFDDDFMSFRIGYGNVDSSITIKTPNETLSLYEDELAKEGKKIAENNKIIFNAPIVCNMKNNGIVGVTGSRKATIGIVKNIIVQVATTHSYEDVRIVLIFPEKEKKDWEWVRWLPHTFDDTRSMRYVSCDSFSTSDICKKLDEVLKERYSDLNTSGYGRKSMKLPYYMFVLADTEAFEDQNIMKYILTNDLSAGVGAVYISERRSMLPKECSEIIEITTKEGIIYNSENAGDKIKFTPDCVSNDFYDKFARNMAPIRVEEKIKATKIPSCVTFLDGYNVKTPYNINIAENWKNAKTFKSMSVPIGVRANGENFYFDIHEKKHGPHGLVAGMTGSGKSEMVQSWILSMALHFSPSDVSFVLIDFKGTGLILPFEKLPHLAGKISNIDKNIHRNLIALENELSRRQVLFDKYGVQNIIDYLKLYHKGQADEPLSFLFIVIDEFAEFKVQFPEFMTVIDRIFAIGRTLGVFNILLTQKPAGVVSDKMNANTRFRWCLKVASSSDSKDMLHHPDAAKITVPGRGFVQVGEDEIFEEIQSFWSGAPYNPSKKDKTVVVPKISGVTLSGKKISYEEIEKTLGFRSDEKEIDAVVNYLHSYTEKNQIPKARKIWAEKLGTQIGLNTVLDFNFDGTGWLPNDGELKPVIGVADDPRQQSQYQAKIDLSGEGHIGIFGAPSTGKTTLLQTLIMSMVCTYSPDDVNIYIMDFNAWGMGLFKGFPHVGGVVNDNEEEKIEKLIKLINKELDERREKFAKISVGSIKAYREATEEKLPYIALIVDNFAPVFQLYPETERFFLNLSRQGGSYGIYLIATANNPMALTYKINQNIKNGIALQMTDRTEYSAIVGKTNGLEPENNEGRGLLKSNPPLEFQTALPAAGDNEAERAVVIKKIAEEMSRVWQGRKAKPIPIMPDIVSYNSIYTDSYTLGLGVDDIAPVGFDFNETHYFPISGMPHSGKSNLLKVILRQIREKYSDAEITVYDSNNGMEHAKEIYSNSFDSPTEFDAYMANLVKELQRRKEMFGNTTENFTPIVIAIDGLKGCFDAVDEKTITRLVQIVKLGKGLGVYLLATENADELAGLYGMGEVLSMLFVESKMRILLGGSFKNHTIFKSSLPYNEAETKVGEFEGYLLLNEKAKRVKFMYEK